MHDISHRPWVIDTPQVRMRAGIGNWEGLIASPYTLHDILRVANTEWKAALAGVDKPWLCWSVDHEWCLLQQQMAKAVGWTPLVGFDHRVGPPPLVPGAVLIDFNRHFGFGTMYPHFPLEFAFAFVDRIAFWHSDLLVPLPQLREYAQRFEAQPDGQIIAVEPALSIRQQLTQRHTLRCWELIGCVTRGASQSNFDHGCGWWHCFYLHPNCPGDAERKKRTAMYWDHGVGIRYWHEHCGGKVALIPEAELDKGHFTRMRRKNYIAAGEDDWSRDLSKELSVNFPLERVCEDFGLGDTYRQAQAEQIKPPNGVAC